jgi:AcrR family transcriptional regulator
MTTSKPRGATGGAREKRAAAAEKGGDATEAGPGADPGPRAKKGRGRTRRTAGVARETILGAAERRLGLVGPAGLRLQEIAADAGVSHPTVLHHFGSREGLLQAVVARSAERLHEDVATALVQSPPEASSLAALFERISAVLDTTGHGRAFGWLALAGLVPDAQGLHLQELARVSHAIRSEKRGAGTPPFRDTEHIVALVGLVLMAQSMVGPEMLAGVGLGGDAEASARFRRWFAQLVARHLEVGPDEPESEADDPKTPPARTES